MKVKFLVLFFLLLLMLSGCGGGLDKKETYNVVVTVNVVDVSTSEAISNCNVVTEDGKSGSNSGGTVTFNLLGQKSYTFIASAPNYQENRQTVQAEKDNLTITVKLTRGKGSISGTVLDDNNAPVVNATVTINELSRTMNSGNDGKFKFEDVAYSDNVLTITVTKTGYADRIYANIKVTPDSPSKDLGNVILSSNPGTLSGRVVDSNDSPVENITVNIVELNQTTTTDYNGMYTFQCLPGTYTIEFNNPNYDKASKPGIEVKKGSTTQLNVKMNPKPGSITGIIVDSNGTGVIDAQITILGQGSSTKSLSNGYFKLDTVPPGNYTLEITNSSFKTSDVTIKVESSKELALGNIAIVEKVGVALNGRVLDLDDGTPISGATIRLIELGTNANSSSDGYFTLQNPRIGTYTVEITADSCSTIQIPNVQIKENLLTTLPDTKLFKNPGTIVGTCKDGETGADLSNVTVTVIETNATITTNASGVFKTTLRSGTYSLKFDTPSYISKNIANIYVGPNTTNNIGIVNLSPKPGIISGITTTGALVQLRGTGIQVTANNTGAFTLTNVTEGTYFIDITLNNYVSKTVSVTVTPNQSVDVGDCRLLALPGKIIGSTNATSVQNLQTSTTVSVVNQLFTFDNVNAGTYTLRFTRDGYQTKDVSISVSPNNTSDTGLVTVSPIDGGLSGYLLASGCTITLVEKNLSQYYAGNAYFQFPNLSPKIYHLTVEKAGYINKVITATVSPGQTTDVGSIVNDGTVVSWIGTPYQNNSASASPMGSQTTFTINYSQTITIHAYGCGPYSGAAGYVYLKAPGGNKIYEAYAPYGGPNGDTTLNDTITRSVTPGNYTLWSGDGYGSAGMAPVSIDVSYTTDILCPSITVMPTSGYNISSIGVRINASDSYSGVGSIVYAVTNSTNNPGGGYTGIGNGGTVTINQPGEWYLHVIAVDGANNSTNDYWTGPYLIGSAYSSNYDSYSNFYSFLCRDDVETQNSKRNQETDSGLSILEAASPLLLLLGSLFKKRKKKKD